MSNMRKSLGPIAVIALLLEVTAGVSAQTTSDEETLTVTLVTAPVCAVELAHLSGSFGEWERAGAIWVDSTPENGAVVYLAATITAQPLNGCDLSISFDGLTGPGGSIPADDPYFAAADDIGGTLHPEVPDGWTHTGVMDTEFRIGFSLQNIPASITSPGDYSGVVRIDVANAV